MNGMHLAIGSLMMLADYMTACKQVFVDLGRAYLSLSFAGEFVLE